MRQDVMYKPGDERDEQRPDPTIIERTDAIIRLAVTCICGSDLWEYRGAAPRAYRAMDQRTAKVLLTH